MEISEFPNISFEHPRGSAFRKYRSQTLAPVQFTNPNSNHRVGDVKPITEVLDTILNEDENKKSKKNKSKKPNPRIVKQKQLQDQMLKDMSIFEQVLNHPQFKKDPFETITTHIENKMLMEAMDS